MRWQIESLAQRFWKKVIKRDACWEWTGTLNNKGYGMIRRGRANEGSLVASRASWQIHFGEIPEGIFVLHKCDNPKCVRPEHLFLGTQKENLVDMCLKNRHHMQKDGKKYLADKNPNSIFNWGIVEEIRKCGASGEPGASIARRFCCTKENVYAILKNKTWIKPAQAPGHPD